MENTASISFKNNQDLGCPDYNPEELDSIGITLEVLKRVPCQFWACDGWEKPFVNMGTCFVCAEIQRLTALAKAEGAQ